MIVAKRGKSNACDQVVSCSFVFSLTDTFVVNLEVLSFFVLFCFSFYLFVMPLFFENDEV